MQTLIVLSVLEIADARANSRDVLSQFLRKILLADSLSRLLEACT